MSADLYLIRATCHTPGRSDESEDLNITYNLSAMLKEAGFEGWSWCTNKPAVIVGRHMIAILNRMQEDPERWRAMNPPNGWGDYDKCLQGRMRAWAEVAAAAGPDDKVGTWL